MMFIDAARLRTTVAAVLATQNLPDRDREWVTDGLVEADLRGVTTHGVIRLEAYVNGWKTGGLNPTPSLVPVVDAGAIAVIDGDRGLGLVVGREAMRIAIERAEAHGVGIVAARNSNHSGMLAQHVIPAADAGMVGYFVSNGPPVLAPWGGSDATLSNNPFAYAIPAATEPAIVLDMACSAAARGRIRLAALEGEPIPRGWALDADGSDTEDPHAAMEGVLLPLGAHKGYGIAVVNEFLSAVLPGALLSAQISSAFLAEGATAMDYWGAGHLAMAIDISRFGEPREILNRVDEMIHTIRSSRPAAAHEQILMPGQHEAELRQQRLADGVPLSDRTVAMLRRVCSATSTTWSDDWLS